MQNSNYNLKSNPFFEILITLLLGAIIGALSLGFIQALSVIEAVHAGLNQNIPYHLVLIPVLLVVIELSKRHTLYFPLRTANLLGLKSAQYWSVFMTPFHFLGTLLSHLSGVSVGRESAVVLYSAGLMRLFRLAWADWGPITSAIAFATVVGQYWVAPFFMMELFGKTNFLQKIYSLMGALLAVLIVKSFGGHQLLSSVDVVAQMGFQIGFFKKLFFLFFFAASAGYLMRLYKRLYFVFSTFFKARALWVKVIVASVLAFFLNLPEFRKYQSLGLSQFTDLSATSGSFINVITKLFFTLISTTLGFLGGEFIPLVYSGVYFGRSFFEYFGHSMLLGSALGAYLLFTGATRFKWTGYILILSLIGFSWWFWAYFIIVVASGFSGPESIYKSETKTFHFDSAART